MLWVSDPNRLEGEKAKRVIPMLTKQQVRWAQSHDWFRYAVETQGGYRVIVRDDYCDREGVWHDGESWFDSFSQLRAWAGY